MFSHTPAARPEMEISFATVNNDFNEVEKRFLSSGLAIEKLENLILQVVEHSRPRRDLRDVIAKFLLVKDRIDFLVMKNDPGHVLPLH